MVIACAAADDVTAWCILAFVITVAKAGSFISAVFTLILAISFVLGMLYFVRPYLKQLAKDFTNEETISKTMVSIIFLVLLLSAYIAEIIGIHALFGAFFAGFIIPQNLKFGNC